MPPEPSDEQVHLFLASEIQHRDKAEESAAAAVESDIRVRNAPKTATTADAKVHSAASEKYHRSKMMMMTPLHPRI